MHTVTARRIMNIPSHRVWAALDDFGAIHRFHPQVRSSPLLTSTGPGLGCERACELYGGGSIRERIVGYEPGRSMTIAIVDAGSFPIRHAQADITVAALDHDRSQVTFSMEFEAKYGFVGRWLVKAIMLRQFRALADGILKGLETHLTTGKLIGRNGVPMEPASAQM